MGAQLGAVTCHGYLNYGCKVPEEIAILTRHPPAPAWKDLGSVWSRWTYLQIPQGVSGSCELEINPAREMLFDLVSRNLQAGTLSSEIRESQETGEAAGKAVAATSRMSFFLGLDYGHRDR